MQLTEIIALDGIVIRKIPATSSSCYSYRDGDEDRLKPNQTIVTNTAGRRFVREERTNSLGGKYLVTFTNDQGSVLHFNVKYDGVGDTIEAAYANYLEKSA